LKAKSLWALIAAKHGVCIHAYADDLQTYISSAASDQNTTTSRLLTVVSDIDRWMSSNQLKLNAGKTEVTWLGTRQQLTKLNMSQLQIKNQVIMPLDKLRDLGVIIDSKLTMESHTASVALAASTNFANFGVSSVRLQLMPDVHSSLPLWLIEWTTATRCCMARLLQSHVGYRWF